ncbi:hypothetical protein KJ765_04905 [Candidatus Micrarchaeota archaeon]|nr:hypothetical protein [Candidatus Micrarchaeota archaeon]
MNLKFPRKLFKAARSYANTFGYRNLQDLIYDSVREKVFEKSQFDETLSDIEIALIDHILETSIARKQLASEEELKAALSA